MRGFTPRKRATAAEPSELEKLIEKHGGPKAGATRNKYGAKKTRGYDSKREADYAAELELRSRASNGDVSHWHEQVGIQLRTSVYKVDFLVFFKNGTHRYVEVKGVETDVWLLKMKAVEDECPAIWAALEVVS
jgi:hypothetical protein